MFVCYLNTSRYNFVLVEKSWRDMLKFIEIAIPQPFQILRSTPS